MDNQELVHHGTKGMKWGIRRFQNPDGSLTPAGKKRYGADGDGKPKSDPAVQKARVEAAKIKAENVKLNERLKAKEALDKTKAENEALKKALKGKGNDETTVSKPKTDDYDKPEIKITKEGKYVPSDKINAKDLLKIRRVSDLTDAELAAVNGRFKLEQSYSELNPKQVSLGERFVKTVLKDIVAPVAIDASKTILSNAVKGAINAGESFVKTQLKKT